MAGMNSLYQKSSLCRAVTGSMTIALKAQKVLSGYAIRVEVVKISSVNSKRGCAYGIEFPCSILGNVKTILSEARINIKSYENNF